MSINTRFEVRINAQLKADFEQACAEAGETGAVVVRRAIQSYVRAQRQAIQPRTVPTHKARPPHWRGAPDCWHS